MLFERPAVLFLLLLLPVVALVFRASYSSDRNILKILKEGTGGLFKSYLSLTVAWLLFLGGLVVTAAGPYIPEYGAGEDAGTGDYVFLVDVSASTDARSSPASPSIGEINRDIALSIAKEMPGARFQIVGYTRLAFSLSVLTGNHEELEDAINNSLQVNSVPSAGSDLANAIGALQNKKLEDPNYENVEYVILLSDGNLSAYSSGNNFQNSRNRRALEEIVESGLKVISVGLGSPDGWRIPEYDDLGNFTGRYVTLRNGNEFVATLHKGNLQEISSATGGRYFDYQEKEQLIQFLKGTLSEGSGQESGGDVMKKQSLGIVFILISAASFTYITRKELY